MEKVNRYFSVNLFITGILIGVLEILSPKKMIVMRPQWISRITLIAATAVLIASCTKNAMSPEKNLSAEQNNLEGSFAELENHQQNTEGILDEPIASLEAMEGIKVDFYAWEDGSAGVLESVSGADFSILQNADISEKTPAEIFWALSSPGTPIPELLVEHHEDIRMEEKLAPMEKIKAGNPQGWALQQLNFRSGSSPCNNSNFIANHCLPKSGYTHGKSFIDTNGNWTWWAKPVRRYKAGFCLSNGTVNDYLYYTVQAGDCNYFRTAYYIWGGPPLLTSSQWNAVSYLSWTWWAGSSTPSRLWYHCSFNGHSGDRYDWSCIYKFGSICD